MKGFKLLNFTFHLWLRFQIICIGIGLLCSLASLNFGFMAFFVLFEAFNALFSALACGLYALIVWAWLIRQEIEYEVELNLLLQKAGLVNGIVISLFAGVFCLGNHDFIPIALGGIIATTMVGQFAISWATRNQGNFDKTEELEVDKLIEQIGTEEAAVEKE